MAALAPDIAASNPVVKIGNSIATPADPVVERKTYNRVIFEKQRFYPYKDDDDPAAFDANKYGDRSYLTLNFDQAGVDQPEFSKGDVWNATKKMPTAFVTSQMSVAPQMIIPNKWIAANGVKTTTAVELGKLSAWDVKDGEVYDAFNWQVQTHNGLPVDLVNVHHYARTNDVGKVGYVSFGYKDEDVVDNTLVVELDQPVSPVPAEELGVKDYGVEPLVGGGACLLTLNAIPFSAGSVPKADTLESPWSMEIVMGELILRMSQAGMLSAGIGVDGAGINWVGVNLVEGKTKGVGPQSDELAGESPYTILIQPVWNGVIISSGVQTSRTNQFSVVTTQSAGVYVPKLKTASALSEPWSKRFLTTEPLPVFVYSTTEETDSPLAPEEETVVDFGTKVTVTALNCAFDIAYVPVFYSPIGSFDEWTLTSKSVDDVVEYTYMTYPIWTANGTDMELRAGPRDGKDGELDGTIYRAMRWEIAKADGDEGKGLWCRRHGELLGTIVQVVEKQEGGIVNGNGNFVIEWTGAAGSRGDPDTKGDWQEYIQSITLNIGTDGSSGTMTIDKYGCAGQHAVVKQSIGAITIDVQEEPSGCTGGMIFKGLGMGIADARNSSGATWTVTLAGLEKKLDEMMLVYAPFLDGETLLTAIGYLAGYAGLIADTSAAAEGEVLASSLDINTSRFDWKSGTPVRQAIEDVMNDVNHTYVVRDGKIFVYELDDYGLPKTLGRDWEPLYPSTQMVSDEQNPDFEDLRNKVVILGMEANFQAEGANTDEANAGVLRVAVRNSVTVPHVPWERPLVEAMPGYIDEDTLEEFADRRRNQSRRFLMAGRISIPGNAGIKPYDRWGGYVINSVSHNLDFVAKTFTTDLDLLKSAT